MEMKPDQLASVLMDLGKDQLKELPHALLYQARERVPSEQQGFISPYEHRAFAREVVQENPLMAISLLAAIPAYQGYKAVVGARSKPSLDQVLQGYAGIGDGIKALLTQDTKQEKVK